MKIYRIDCNWWILFLALAFGLMQTKHFGWNFAPASDAEVICDGITLLIGALAFVKPYQRPSAVVEEIKR